MGGVKPFKGVLVFLAFRNPLVFLFLLFSSAIMLTIIMKMVAMVIYLLSRLW